MNDAPGWTENGSAGLLRWGLCCRPQTPPPEAWPLDSIRPLALALTLTRPFRYSGKESELENQHIRKKLPTIHRTAPLDYDIRQ